MTGNDAVAYAVRQIDPHVVAAYPITPQTELMHRFAEYVARGEVRTELVTVESEYSAMSAVLAAAASGARAFTATSANGLAYMLEIYHNTAALRLPVVLSLVNRHIGGLLNIHNDHGDAMLARNAAWIQIHAENTQEAYDNAIQAFRIAEDPRVRLPVTICHDGFIVSHTVERLLTIADAEVADFVGDLVPAVDLLDTANPRSVGPLVLPDLAFNLYAQISEAMRWAPQVIEEIGREYGETTGRAYGLLDAYRMEDAQVAIVAMGSLCGTVRTVVDLLRSTGVRAGMVKLRVFRPFPNEPLAAVLCQPALKAVAVIDKVVELGTGGPLLAETAAAVALHAQNNGRTLPLLANAIVGVGGRDVTLADINGIFRNLLDLAAGEQHLGPDAIRFVDVGNQGDCSLDVTASPLARERSASSKNIVMVGRGGQGARTASYLLAQVMIELGKYAQGFPAYGPERTGAPIKAFTKISDHPVEERQQIYDPDVLAVFDETLLDLFTNEIERLAEDGVLIVNTRMSPAQVREQIGLRGRNVYTVDATGISVREFGSNRPNAAMMGAMATVLELCDLQSLKNAFRANLKRLSDKLMQGNWRSMDRAAATVRGE